MGFPEGVYRVGPLGRLNAVEKIDTPLANEELKTLQGAQQWQAGRKYSLLPLCPPDRSPVLHRARRVNCCDDPDILSTDILNTRKDYKGEGVGVIEAPRGTLIHTTPPMRLAS